MITSIGRHKVKCGDIMDGIDDLMQGEKADIIYSDPPWGQGNLKYWQTINNRHTGAEKTDIQFDDFLPSFFRILQKYAKRMVILEYGVRWRNDIIQMCAEHGLMHGGAVTSLYQGGNKLLPLDVHLISKKNEISLGVLQGAGIEQEFKKNCVQKRGLSLVRYIFSTVIREEKTVLDPMCGMGYTAQVASEMGMSFRGNELNAKRLKKTIARLEKNA